MHGLGSRFYPAIFVRKDRVKSYFLKNKTKYSREIQEDRPSPLDNTLFRYSETIGDLSIHILLF